MLGKCIAPFPVESLYVADEAPANLSIDQDTELRASGESRAAIRYFKHTIDADDARRHI